MEDHVFSSWIRMIPALAFVPTDEVENVFEELANHPDFPAEGQPIINYFEDTYVGRAGRRNRRPASFSPAQWNVHDRTLNGQQRTNNEIEGWHRGFQVTCGTLPNIYRFIDAIKKQQGIHNFDVAQLAAGQAVPPKNKRYADISRRIQSIVQDYQNRDHIEFLRNIAHNFEF
jgi:hypothetical protein